MVNTVRTNKKAIYANVQEVNGDAVGLTLANLIPISADVSKSYLDDNSVEIPVLKGTLGANDSVIISETQGASIPSFPIGGGLNGEAPALSPVHPLIMGCYHKLEEFEADFSTESSGSGDTRIHKYSPVDDPIHSCTIIYKFDKFSQKMVNAFGTMSGSWTVGEAASMTFEFQSAFKKPDQDFPKTGTAPTFKSVPVVTGQSPTILAPALPAPLSNCVRSFSFTQGTTTTPVDCITREGNRDITYIQTARSATGEIVFDIDADNFANGATNQLFDYAGGKKALSAPITSDGTTPSGLIIVAADIDPAAPKKSTGNTFIFGSNNFKIGSPAEGDIDTIGTFTCPITFIPTGGKPDYEFGFIGGMQITP